MKTTRLFAAIIVALTFATYSHISAQFSISVTPSESAATVAGGSAIYNISVQADAGFEATIFLSVQSSMPGVTANLSKTSLNKPYGNLTLTASPKSDTGTAIITVSASAGSVTKIAECRLRALKNPQWKIITNELGDWGYQLTHNSQFTVIGVGSGRLTYFLADGKKKTEMFPSSTQGITNSKVILDRTGALWLLGNTGISPSYTNNAIGRWKQDNFILYTCDNSTLGGNDVFDLDFDRNNTPIVISYKGNSRFIQKLENDEWTDILSGRSSLYIPDICIDSIGALWYPNPTGGVCRMKDGMVDTFTVSNSLLASNDVNILCSDKSGAIWCYNYTTGTASVFNGTSWKRVDLVYGGTNIVFDGKNSLWMLTHNKMINYDDNGITVYDASNTPLPQKFNEASDIGRNKMSFVVDADDNIWIGLRGGNWPNQINFGAIFNPDGLKGIPLVLSAEEPEAMLPLQISPNPASETFTVHIPPSHSLGASGSVALTVRDVFGRITNYELGITNGEATFSTAEYASGVYFVEVSGADGRRVVGKVVVSR